MPKGIPNKKPSTPPMNAAPVAPSPAPLIILQPQADGTRIDAYGLEPAAAIDELRRALLHLVARQSGVTVISETISRHAAVVATPALVPAAKAKPPMPPTNGTGPKKLAPLQHHRKQPAEIYDDEPDLRPDLAAMLDDIEA